MPAFGARAIEDPGEPANCWIHFPLMRLVLLTLERDALHDTCSMTPHAVGTQRNACTQPPAPPRRHRCSREREFQQEASARVPHASKPLAYVSAASAHLRGSVIRDTRVDLCVMRRERDLRHHTTPRHDPGLAEHIRFEANNLAMALFCRSHCCARCRSAQVAPPRSDLISKQSITRG